MNRLSTALRTVASALVEGNSIRATVRMTNVSKPTVLKLLADMGAVCSAYHDVFVRGLRVRRVQADEIWSFVGAKQNVSAEKAGVWGDIWTWTAIDADTKLMIGWLVGPKVDFRGCVAGLDIVWRRWRWVGTDIPHPAHYHDNSTGESGPNGERDRLPCVRHPRPNDVHDDRHSQRPRRGRAHVRVDCG
jgi:hypothetical protein